MDHFLTARIFYLKTLKMSIVLYELFDFFALIYNLHSAIILFGKIRQNLPFVLLK